MSRNKGNSCVYNSFFKATSQKKSTFHIKFYTETVEQSEVLWNGTIWPNDCDANHCWQEWMISYWQGVYCVFDFMWRHSFQVRLLLKWWTIHIHFKYITLWTFCCYLNNLQWKEEKTSTLHIQCNIYTNFPQILVIIK